MNATIVGASVVASVFWLAGVVALAVGYRRSTGLARSRWQWLAWSLVAVAIVGLVAATLSALVDWPARPIVGMASGLVLLPLGLALGRAPRLAPISERVLVETIVAGGLVTLVLGVYVVVVLGLGRVPAGDERAVLALSMAAAGVAALLAFPARRVLEEWANQRVYGERHSPDETLRTFGGRMSRAVPMDELLLQLVESLKKTMHLAAAEIWTGTDGQLDRAASVPDRGPSRVELGREELSVVARAHAQGNTWAGVWVPALVEGREAGMTLRIVSIAHLGELLGLLVLERQTDDVPFSDDEDRVLVELARQVGLALHNVRLDSALQASLDELRERNVELVASRARIVAAADEARRHIERNLHDGAQQHLVALAVKVGLAKQLLESDPAVVEPMLDELRDDVQTTLTELRELAHGIYPPLLRDRGLREALRTAANRTTLPTDVTMEDVGRFASDVEAAVYFCCLEAMQNAGKHAGEQARVRVAVGTADTSLWFEVRDDGAGFDPATAADGHGFVNMRDRLGAYGGELTVVSAPGEGTSIRGEIPVAPHVSVPEAVVAGRS